mmetsp:Transcript_12612/g.36713  ORF Transcript_12612/g.36713 Transcript_12612/m.36713 type:complete len:206 (+) Transcript_12612:1701-2318(+)
MKHNQFPQSINLFVYLRFRNPVLLSVLLLSPDSAPINIFSTAALLSDLAISAGVLPSLSLTDNNALSLTSSLALSGLPWNAAQCKAFQPSPSTMAGFPPKSLTFRMAAPTPATDSPPRIINGVHPLSFVRKLQFFLLMAATNGSISALTPASHVSKSNSSNDCTLLPLPAPPPICRTTAFPPSSTTSSSSVNSANVFSSKILSAG